MKKVEIVRKVKYLVIVNGKNTLITSKKENILELIKEELRNKDVHIVIKDLSKD